MSEDSVNEQGGPPTDETAEVNRVTGVEPELSADPAQADPVPQADPVSQADPVPQADPVSQADPESQADPAAYPSSPAHPRRRMIAAMAAIAVICGAAGTAAGLVIGHRSGGGSAGLHSASSNPFSGHHWTFTWPPGTTGPGNGSGGSGQGLGGFGQGLQNPGLGTATPTQLTGMVRVASTLTDGAAAGTGMILTPSGEVVTNNHVVNGSTRLRVTVMTTGSTYTARVVGTDSTDDIAVLQLQGASGLTPVTIDHNPLAVGDKVTAIGDAGGTPGHLSSSPGTVGGLGRSITTQGELADGPEHLGGMIEIKADVISGDSGGAVLDSQGEVTGMTTAAGSTDSLPTGYAIPIAKVLRIADRIESGPASSRIHLGYPAFLGVELSSQTRGTTIAGVVQGSPAQRAGLSTGDRITSVGGTKVASGTQLRTVIVGHAIGDSVTVTWRDGAGSSHSATVTLVSGPAD